LIGGVDDWRQFPRHDVNSDLLTMRVNPEKSHGWFTAERGDSVGTQTILILRGIDSKDTSNLPLLLGSIRLLLTDCLRQQDSARLTLAYLLCLGNRSRCHPKSINLPLSLGLLVT